MDDTPRKRPAYQSPVKVFRLRFAEPVKPKHDNFEHWNTLPSDIVERIMMSSTLSTADALNMSLTCKAWKPRDNFLARTLCRKRIHANEHDHVSRKNFIDYFVETAHEESRVQVLKEAVNCGSTDILWKCYSCGYWFNSPDNKGQSILCTAIEAGRVHVIEFLIKRCHAYVNLVDHFGESPLMFAIYKGSLEIIRCLLNNGASVFTQAYDLATPLYLAVNENRVAVVELLLKYGSPVDAPDTDGLTPLYLAVKNQNFDMVKLLHRYAASTDIMVESSGFTPLHQAVYQGDNDVALFFLQNGVNERSKTIDGKTILHVACLGSKFDTCKWIIERGNVGVNELDEYEQSPLHYAVEFQHLDIIQILLENGANAFDGDLWLKIAMNIGWSNLHVSNPDLFKNAFVSQLMLGSGATA